jgi:hypothetical protein
MTKQDLAKAVRRLMPLLAVAVLGAGCAEMDKMMHKEHDGKQPPPRTTQSPPAKGEFAPFQIKFKSDGTPVVVGQDGRPLRGVRVNFPRKATQLRNIYSFTAVEAFGSHYIVMEVAPGYYMCFDLPHEDGTYGTSCEQPSPPPIQ